VLYVQTDVHWLSYLAQFLLEMFQICKKNRKSFCVEGFFRKSCGLWGTVEKYCTGRQATDDNMVHAHCMLDTLGYKHTLTICNTYGFSTVTMVARKRLKVTLLPPFFCLHGEEKISVVWLTIGTEWGRGDRGSTVVKVLCYKSEGRWFNYRWFHWNFSLS